MKMPAKEIAPLVLADLAGFAVMAGVALFLGVAVNCLRTEPLPLFTGQLPGSAGSLSFPEIPLAGLQDLLSRHEVEVIDARPPAFFAAGHIPGAINVPYEKLKLSPHVPPRGLPASKAARLVVYCSDVSCPAAKSAARILRELGYRDVSIFPGGWYVWKRDGLPVETSSP